MADQSQDIALFVDAPEGDTFTPASEPAAQVQDINTQMAADMVKFGNWSQDEADQYLVQAAADEKAEGAETAHAPAKPEIPEGVDELTFAAFAGPKDIHEYKFEPPPEGVEAAPEQAAQIRELFMAEAIPAAIGNMVAKLYGAACAAPPNSLQIQSSTSQTQTQLERMYGADTERFLEAARGEVGRLAARNPNIPKMLDESGLSSNFYVVNSLINLARARGRLK
jgi:hypothetical protein